MAKRMIETRRRGILGWMFLTLFWLWSAFMAYATGAGLLATAERSGKLVSEAEKSGHAVGTVLGFGINLGIWAAGAAIIGMFVMLTRGRREMVEVDDGK